MEFSEVGENDPGDRAVHPRLFWADSIVANVIGDLLFVSLVEILRPVEEALCFHKHERATQLEEIIHPIAEDVKILVPIHVGEAQ